MKLDELITLFARNNGIDKPDDQNGHYLIPMEGVGIHCYQESGKICLQAEIAPLAKSEGQRQSQSRLLLEKTMGLILEQRSSLSIDEEKGIYQLYQRMPLEDLNIEDFQEAVEKFGGCGIYYKGLLGQGGESSAPPLPNGMMMP
ncbi:CesT family type III secretion system chaperone [Parendozoicomonas haliclonae]|uniref:Tir chaperone protein (CesT) n=1 Tax=Parendozoicomonas haliclonae TaxID=1960125 RepID=A0A1X7AF15_9GAMM|nr:CesT family type III secretion system chaperone [Parendozoicomonas haliclonae]SMA33805.1 Tir chaperone protein (CesT) [Parendozoicomonas haliclonae]